MTPLLGKCDCDKISDSFWIFICCGGCHHYCKTQVLGQDLLGKETDRYVSHAQLSD